MTNRGEKAKLPGKQSFSGKLSFYFLHGDSKDRTLGFVEYDSSGNRTEHTMSPKGSWNQKKHNLMKSLVNQANPDRTIPDISFKKPSQANNPYDLSGEQKGNSLPLYTTIDVKVKASGYAAEIGAASAGPDRQWGTKDDITTWSKRR